MNCNEVRELLPLYVDNMLEPSQMDALAEHLITCDACRQEYQELTQILSLLANIEEVPLPEEFDLNLRAELQKEAEVIKHDKVLPLKKRKWSGWKRFTSIAAVFVVGLFSVLLYNNIGEFNMEHLGDTYNMTNESNDSSSKKAQGSETAQDKQVNAGSFYGNSKDDAVYGLKSSTKNSAVGSTSNTQNETADNIGEAAAGDSQRALNTSNLSENEATENITNPAETLADNLKAKRSYTCVPEDFNPSRYLETLSEEDAQIYKELMNAKIYLSSGRDSNAVIYYMKQLKKLLGDCNYELISCYQEPEGLWNIEISITTIDKDGNKTKEDVMYCGQDGELWKKELSLLTETV